MSLQEYYEDSFRSEQGRSLSELASEALLYSKGLYQYATECKDRFLTNADWKGLRILEMGAGRGGVSLHLAKLGAQVTLVDFSPSALLQAEKIFAEEKLSAQMVVADVTFPDVSFPHKFDMIIDSHLLHCLTSDPDRSSYYQLIHDYLAPNGLFIAETMVHRKKLLIPDGFMFDQKNILWQMFGKWIPIRRILDSLDLEQELQNAGLQIIYFYYYGQYGFVPHKSFMDIPSEILPAAVRFAVRNQAN